VASNASEGVGVGVSISATASVFALVLVLFLAVVGSVFFMIYIFYLLAVPMIAHDSGQDRNQVYSCHLCKPLQTKGLCVWCYNTIIV